METHIMSGAKFVSEFFIRPKCEAEHSPMQSPYHLGPLDFGLLSYPYSQRGFLFSNKPSSFDSLLDKLKVSLSLVLAHFYPYAGQLETERYEEEHSCSIYIDCSKGPGVRFIHATATTSVDDITPVQPCHVFGTTDVPLFIASFFDLGERVPNHDGHNRPLLSIQVTELIDGVFLGCTMNHCVADGTSLIHFMSMWSEIFTKCDDSCTEITFSRIPIYERPIPDGYTPIIKLPYLEPDEFMIPFVEVIQFRKRIFHFPATSLAMLKAKVNSECRNISHGSKQGCPKISSLQALSALLWRSITRSRKLAANETTTFGLVANLRPRFNPPLSDDYFGNFISAVKATANVSELLSNDLGWAAMLIYLSVVTLDEKSTTSAYLEPFIEGPHIIRPDLGSVGPNPVLINGSPRFNMYGPEFGLGKATAVRTGYADKADGRAIAYPSREGDGSIDLDVCLPTDTMTALLSDAELLEFESWTLNS